MITFKYAYEHLKMRIECGEPLAVDTEGGCVYNKAVNGGCAIGAHIPESLYQSDMEGCIVSRLFCEFPEVGKLFEPGAPWSVLQRWHDGVAKEDSFPNNTCSVASAKKFCEAFIKSQEEKAQHA